MEAKIIEGNKLIAEFMGFKPAQCINGWAWDNNKIIKPISLHGSLINAKENGKFHSSWDWLMPVVMEIGNRTGYTLLMGETHSYWCNEGQHDELSEFGGYSNIENIWEAVIEFIKWHNK